MGGMQPSGAQWPRAAVTGVQEGRVPPSGCRGDLGVMAGYGSLIRTISDALS